MPELLPTERLRPCLIDRITDHAPNKKVEGREQRVLSMQQYRQAVLRDLAWLLNASNRDIVDEIVEFPEVKDSVLNYGIPDMCGWTASSVDPIELTRRITKALRIYEPRILPGSLRVTPVKREDDMTGNAVSFQIEGELWAQPFHEMLLIKTDVDLESGQFSVREVGH